MTTGGGGRRAVPGPAGPGRDAAALLLDFDGTLADSESEHFRCYDAAFGHFGHRLDPEEYRLRWTHLGEGARGEVDRHALAAIDLSVVERLKAARFSAACRSGAVRLYPDAAPFLARLAGRRAAIASNSAESDIRAVLAAAGIADPGKPVVGGAPGLRGKPAPDLFLRAAAVLGVDPAECLVVEDTRKGVLAAIAAGMRVVVVRRPHNTDQPFPEAEGEVGSLGDLERFP